MPVDLNAQLNIRANEVELALETILILGELQTTKKNESEERHKNNRLLEAMRYSVLGGGKRIRPFLVLETAALCCHSASQITHSIALQAAVAVELVHCYSLIHDDLPAMDDDDTRRGRPTLHKTFDDATAILAGDALLTLAFEHLASPTTSSGSLPITDASLQLKLISELATASGHKGMVQGQMLDLAAEGRFDESHQPLALSTSDIMNLQQKKTGALIQCAVRMGAMIGGASPQHRQALTQYAQDLGLAFQIADDLIDYEGDPALAGKATAKDASRGKATFVSLLGADGAKVKLQEVIVSATQNLILFGDKANMLREFIRFMAIRSF